MYSKITNLSEEVHEFDVPNTIPQNKTEFTHNIKTLLAKLNITNTQSYVDQFFDQLKLSKNPCINNLQVNNVVYVIIYSFILLDESELMYIYYLCIEI